MKIARIRLIVLVMIGALFAAACTGGASPTAAPAPTTAPADSGDATESSGDASSASGDAAAAAEGFYLAIYAGEDPAAFVCASAPGFAEAFTQAAEASAAAMQGATVDASGLTFTVTEEDADSATVEVAGEIVYTVSGVDTPIPYPATPVNVVVEDGAWKVCG
jgi:hypothetical protein